MKHTFTVLLLIMEGISGTYAQKSDSLMTFSLNKNPAKKNIHKVSYLKFVIPTAMISYGVIAQGSNSLKKLDHSTHHEITEHGINRKSIDNYTQFAPAIAVYGLDFAASKRTLGFFVI